MKNSYKYAPFLIFCLMLWPSFSYATTVSELQAQITSMLAQMQLIQTQLGSLQSTPASTPSSCPTLTYDLYRGLKDSGTGNQVTALQKFLAQDSSVYPEGLITGYYGQLTEKAVQRWQAKYSVVSSGLPSTTGYGSAGPKTRARIKEICGVVVPPKVSSGVYEPVAGDILVRKNDYFVKWVNSSGLSQAFVNVWLVSQGASSLYTLVASSESALSSGVIGLTEKSTSFSYTPSESLSDGSYYIKVCYYQFQTKNKTQNCISSATFSIVATHPELEISTTYIPDGVAPAGTANFIFGKYVLDAAKASENIKVSSIDIKYEDNGYQTSLSGCYLYENTTKLNTTGLVPSGSGVQTFSLSSPLVVSKGGSKTLELKCNIASWTMESPFYRWTLSNVSAVGLTSSSTAIVDKTKVETGPKISIIFPNAFLASVASSSPVSASASQGEVVVAGKFDISAASEDIYIDFIPVTFTGTDRDDLNSVSIWDGDTRLGLACVPCSSSDEMYLYIAWVIPVDEVKTLTVKAHLNSSATVGGNFRLGINAKESHGVTATSHAQVTGSPGTTLYGTFLTITD